MRTRRCSICHVDIQPGTGWAEVEWHDQAWIGRDGRRLQLEPRPISTYFCDEHEPPVLHSI